jgi:hypothetical protein
MARTRGLARKGLGAAHAWLLEYRDFAGQECLPWPFTKDSKHHIGRLSHNGQCLRAQVFMCELAHGQRPSAKHVFAWTTPRCREHSCCNPMHLEWATRRVVHLRSARISPRGLHRRQRVVTDVQIAVIRATPRDIRGATAALARKLGLPVSTVNFWQYEHGKKQKRYRIILPAMPAITTRDPLLARISEMVPRFPGRDDVIQSIALALLEGRTTFDALRAGGLRAFLTAFRRDNFEQSGFSVSLDIPKRDGRSWHDTLMVPA